MSLSSEFKRRKVSRVAIGYVVAAWLIAQVAVYFGDSQFALKIKGKEMRTSTVRMATLWYAILSEARRTDEFKKLVTDLNLVEYWRAYGWADACTPLGDDDFTCICSSTVYSCYPACTAVLSGASVIVPGRPCRQ